MTLLEALKPKTFYETAQRVLRNYRNWRFYRTSMLQLLKTGALKQYGLRLDAEELTKSKKFSLFRRPKYVAYYALNLEPEILMMGEEAIELEKSRVFESLLKKKALYEEVGLGELIEAKTERVKNEEYYAYFIQIQYRPSSTAWEAVYCGVWLFAIGAIAYGLAMMGLEYKTIADWVSTTMTSK